MNPSDTPTPVTAPVDQDLAAQAVPGHGIPSQDPDPRAQVRLTPAEAEREARSVLVGGGMVAGAATGALVGVAVAGPVGVVVGGTLGAVAGAVGGVMGGAMGGSATSDAVKPEGLNPADPRPADPARTKA